MKRIVVAAITAASIAAPLAVPALASANATTSTVARQFSTQVHNRARLVGDRIISTSVRCASNGGGYYTCWATWTASGWGVASKWGEYLNVTPTRWYSVDGTARQIW